MIVHKKEERMSLLAISSLILGLIIWLLFNKFVTRFYFGANFIQILYHIVGEMFVCWLIAMFIIKLLGSFLGPILEALGGALLFLIKAVLVIALILLVLGGAYVIYYKINGNKYGTNDSSKIVNGTSAHVKMMYCAKCGKQIQSTIQFCNYCGYPVINNALESVINDTEINLNNPDNLTDSSNSDYPDNCKNYEIIPPQNSKLKFCYKCGQSLELNVRFCSRCGSDQELSGTNIPPSIHIESIVDKNETLDNPDSKAISNIIAPTQPQNEKKVFCAFCGSSISVNVKHCNFCGKPNTYLQQKNIKNVDEVPKDDISG